MNNQTVSQKTTGRENAIKLLESQLRSGTKPAKRKYLKAANGEMVGTIPYGANHAGEYIPLEPQDIERINNQINALNRKQRYTETLQQVKASRGITITQVPVGMHQVMRPKNPKTKLYRFINKVYTFVGGK